MIGYILLLDLLKRATSKEILESVKMVRRAYTLAAKGLPDFRCDPEVRKRADSLKNEAWAIIEKIKKLSPNVDDPLIDPQTLYMAVKTGILDAVGLQGNSIARGEVKVKFENGAYDVV
jgi:hypothetical protein